MRERKKLLFLSDVNIYLLKAKEMGPGTWGLFRLHIDLILWIMSRGRQKDFEFQFFEKISIGW